MTGQETADGPAVEKVDDDAVAAAAHRDVVGQVVGGSFGDIIVRQKAGKELEIGSILVSKQGDTSLILQVFALEYGSQIGQNMQEMMSGQGLEDGVAETRPYEPELVNYVLARIKPLARVRRSRGGVRSVRGDGGGGGGAEVTIPKAMPPFFGTLSDVTSGDLDFVGRGGRRGGSIMVGYMRSGTRVLEDVEVRLPAEEVFSHHVLIPATTGRGKSNLVKTMMWHALDSDGVGALVLDAHDEYYGRHVYGLKDHPRAATRLAYYTAGQPASRRAPPDDQPLARRAVPLRGDRRVLGRAAAGAPDVPPDVRQAVDPEDNDGAGRRPVHGRRRRQEGHAVGDTAQAAPATRPVDGLGRKPDLAALGVRRGRRTGRAQSRRSSGRYGRGGWSSSTRRAWGPTPSSSSATSSRRACSRGTATQRPRGT